MYVSFAQENFDWLCQCPHIIDRIGCTQSTDPYTCTTRKNLPQAVGPELLQSRWPADPSYYRVSPTNKYFTVNLFLQWPLETAEDKLTF
jgi:hypothetical protein